MALCARGPTGWCPQSCPCSPVPAGQETRCPWYCLMPVSKCRASSTLFNRSWGRGEDYGSNRKSDPYRCGISHNLHRTQVSHIQEHSGMGTSAYPCTPFLVRFSVSRKPLDRAKILSRVKLASLLPKTIYHLFRKCLIHVYMTQKQFPNKFFKIF